MWTSSYQYENGWVYGSSYRREFEGIISSVTSFGAFVELPNLIEGLAKLDSFKGSSYYFDESTFSLISAKDKRGYRLGDRVKIKVIASSKITHKIDFEIVEKLIWSKF